MNVKVIMMGAVFAIIVIGASVGSSFFVAQYILENSPAISAEGEAMAAEVEAPPIYVELDPFVVNFVQEEALRYLQLTVQLMSRDAKVVEDVDSYMPQIRNELILLLSGHAYGELITREGKETIREEIRVEINRILGLEDDGVESVFLTGFVMQ